MHYLREIQDMGVASLKLEGRMKRPEYVATVTAVYRKAIDEGVVTPEMMQLLHTAFNRQGFTDGYYTGKVDRNMLGVREETQEDAKWLQRARQSYESGEMPLVDVKFRAMVSSTGSWISVTDPDGNLCRVEGPMPEQSRSYILTAEVLAQRIAKTGGTPYNCAEVGAHVEPGLIIPASAINAMRRDVLNQLTAVRARHREFPLRRPRPVPSVPGPKGIPGLTIQVTSREQLTPRVISSECAMLYVPIHILAEDLSLAQTLINRGRVAAVLPRIIQDEDLPRIRLQMSDLRQLGLKDILVSNVGHLIPAREAGFRLHGDFGLNIYNSASMTVLKNLEFVSATASFEMTLPQIRDLSKAVNTEILAYGRLPLMITEHCMMKNRTGQCSCHLGQAKLTDKTGAEFYLIREGASCRNVILNGKKLSWLDRQNDLAKLGLWAIRLYFTTENAREVERILDEYLAPAPFDPGACTRGLYLRGVE